MTPLQLDVLDFTREMVAVAGVCPSIRELATRFNVGIASAQGAIDALVEQGTLERVPGKHRSLRVPGSPDLRAVPTPVIAAELARRGVTLASLDPKAVMAVGQQVSCAADTCGRAVERGHLMCRTHWFGLPADLRERILRTNSARDRAGFERAVTQARDLIDSGQWRKRA